MPARRRSALTVGLALAVVALAVGGAAETHAAGLVAPPGFVQIQEGPAGGSVWQGFVRDPAVPGQRRPDVVYLPPHASRGARYPVLYLLHGLPGSPWELTDGLHLADTADPLIVSGRVRPFVAVMPPAGATARFFGEWTGVWEDELVRVVVPWARRSLQIDPTTPKTTIAGLSAGAYGAIDIGLRHPWLAGTLEAWSGYFRAPRDGGLARAGAAVRASHDPTKLLDREAALLRRVGTRVYLSAGTRDRGTLLATLRFGRSLTAARIPHRVLLLAGGHDGSFWRRQLPDALEYAFGVRASQRVPAWAQSSTAAAVPS